MTSNTSSRRQQSIPNELITLVFQQMNSLLSFFSKSLYFERHHTLRACCRVNKQFYSIANPMLWSKPFTTLESCYRRLLTGLQHASSSSSSRQQHQPSPGRYIHQLSFSRDYFTDAHLLRLLPYVPNLQSFDLSFRTQITTDTTLQRLPRYCQHFTSLELHSVTLSTFTALGRHCHQLGRLYLRDRTIIHPNFLKPLADNNIPLKDLTIFNSRMNKDTQAADLARLRHLTYLEVIYVFPQIIKSMLLAASTTTTTSTTYPWPCLKKIYFVDCWDIDDKTWLTFIKTHPQLQDISIRDCMMSNDSMIPMARSLPELIHLRFIRRTPLTPDGIRQFIQHASPTLQTVRCNDCTHIKASDFKELPQPPTVDNQNYLVKLYPDDINIIRRTTTTSSSSNNHHD